MEVAQDKMTKSCLFAHSAIQQTSVLAIHIACEDEVEDDAQSIRRGKCKRSIVP